MTAFVGIFLFGCILLAFALERGFDIVGAVIFLSYLVFLLLIGFLFYIKDYY